MLRPSSQHHPIVWFRSGPSRLLVLALSLALAACDGGDSPLGPSEGQLDPAGEAAALATSQRIAFISYRDPGVPSDLVNGNVYKTDPQGQNEVRVTSEPGYNDYAPSWSYDNKRIAMVRYRLEEGVGRSDIWVVDADGSGGHWVRPTPSPWDLSDPTWAPDGSHLVLTVWWDPHWYLAKMELATGNIYLIHPIGGGIVGTRPSYNKAGTKIVYVGKNYNTIEQINADGSGRKVRYTASITVDHPTFSPDGKKIAFEKGYSPGNTDIFVKNLADGTTKRLTFSTAADRNATWSPDGSKIAFTSERSGKAQIWTMNAATGGSLLRITHTTSHERYPSWSH